MPKLKKMMIVFCILFNIHAYAFNLLPRKLTHAVVIESRCNIRVTNFIIKDEKGRNYGMIGEQSFYGHGGGQHFTAYMRVPDYVEVDYKVGAKEYHYKVPIYNHLTAKDFFCYSQS